LVKKFEIVNYLIKKLFFRFRVNFFLVIFSGLGSPSSLRFFFPNEPFLRPLPEEVVGCVSATLFCVVVMELDDLDVDDAAEEDEAEEDAFDEDAAEEDEAEEDAFDEDDVEADEVTSVDAEVDGI